MRRRTAYWAAGVVAVLAVAVLTDLPTHASVSYRQGTLRGYLAAVGRDVAPCRVALHDALAAYAGSSAASAASAASGPSGPSAEPRVPLSTAAQFTQQGIEACGFSNTGVVALGTTSPPRQVATPAVARIAHQVDAWAYLDAFTLLQDLKSVISHPGSRGGVAAFDRVLGATEARASLVERLVAAADREAGLPVDPIRLTAVGSLLPRGRLRLPGGARPGRVRP